MSEFQRQHPIAAITRAVDLIRDNLITIVLILVFGAGRGGPSFLWMFVGLFLFLLLAGAVGWWRFHYKIEDGELQIRQGLFVRKNLYLTRDRVQVIDVSSGLIQRIFGLVRVEIKTAGSTSRQASLSAVSQSEADRLTRLLRSQGDSEETADDVPDRNGEALQIRLPVRDLLIAASTSGSFGVALSVIATIFSQAEPFLSDTDLYEQLLRSLPSETDTSLILSLLLIFVLFAWLMSFFGTLLRFGDFSICIDREEVRIHRGLLEKKSITIPFNRIQAVRIVEGILRQPFGYVSVYVESAGYGDQQESGSVALIPLVKRKEVASFLQKTLPDYSCSLSSVKPPKRSRFRYILHSSAVFAIILAAIQLIFQPSPTIWVLMSAAFFWGWLRHRDAAVGIDTDRIVIRSRKLARTTVLVLRNRVQDMSGRASWIQRIRHLANLEISVASGDQGRRFGVGELEAESVNRLLPWIETGQEKQAVRDSVSSSGEGERLPDWVPG